MKAGHDATVPVPPPTPTHLQMDSVVATPQANNDNCYTSPSTSSLPPIFPPTDIASPPSTPSPPTNINTSIDINTATNRNVGESPRRSPRYHSSHSFAAVAGQSRLQPISEQQANNNATNNIESDDSARPAAFAHGRMWFRECNIPRSKISKVIPRQWYAITATGDRVYPGTAIGKNMTKLDAFMTMFPPKQLNLMVELTNVNLRKAKLKISSKGEMKSISFFIPLLLLHSKTCCSNIIIFDRRGDQVHRSDAPNDSPSLLQPLWTLVNNFRLQIHQCFKSWADWNVKAQIRGLVGKYPIQQAG